MSDYTLDDSEELFAETPPVPQRPVREVIAHGLHDPTRNSREPTGPRGQRNRSPSSISSEDKVR